MTGSPYKVLGIEPSATDEEVKAAYRNLAKKYHPDNYADSPLADLAEEKMKAINEAYDTIMKKRKQKQYKNTPEGETPENNDEYYDPEFEQVIIAIESRDFVKAEYLLNQIGKDESKRTAYWYYLMGIINENRGWYFEAYKMYAKAVNDEPTNQKYREAMYRMQGNAEREGGSENVGSSVCDCCSAMICADCLCECCGGRSSRCC